jgi:hypothetical protein
VPPSGLGGTMGTEVVFFRKADGSAPVIDWIFGLPEKVRQKVYAKIERLGELGYQLRRPDCDFLRNGIFELRIKAGTVNYRVLYFFHAKRAVLCSGLTKERAVPEIEIRRALDRRAEYAADPAGHTFRRSTEGGRGR